MTYLGSGQPILYHGPFYAAAHQLLQKHQAAIMASELSADVLLSVLQGHLATADRGATAAANALGLAGSDFLLSHIRQRFWDRISKELDRKPPLPLAAS